MTTDSKLWLPPTEPKNKRSKIFSEIHRPGFDLDSLREAIEAAGAVIVAETSFQCPDSVRSLGMVLPGLTTVVVYASDERVSYMELT